MEVVHIFKLTWAIVVKMTARHYNMTCSHSDKYHHFRLENMCRYANKQTNCMTLNHSTPLSSDYLTNVPRLTYTTQLSHPNKQHSFFLFTDFTDILFNVNVALIDVVSLVVNVFNKNKNKQKQQSTDKCRKMSNSFTCSTKCAAVESQIANQHKHTPADKEKHKRNKHMFISLSYR